MATYLDFAIRPRFEFGLPALSAALFGVCAVGACVTIASAWFWRRSFTVALALAVTAASLLASVQAQFHGDLLFDVRLIGPPLALAALATGKDRPPRSWLWIPAAFLIAPLPVLLNISAVWWWDLVSSFSGVVVFGILGITLLWLFVDARLAIAFGAYFEVIYVLRSFSIAPRLSDAPTAGQGLIIALLAVVLAALALRARRRAIA